jgi:hypothetical protein
VNARERQRDKPAESAEIEALQDNVISLQHKINQFQKYRKSKRKVSSNIRLKELTAMYAMLPLTRRQS